MPTRIDVYPRPEYWPDGLPYRALSYSMARDLDAASLARAADLLADPLTEQAVIGRPVAALPAYAAAVSVGYLPGVTDNPGASAAEVLIAAGVLAPGEAVHSGVIHLIDAEPAAPLHNPLIQRREDAPRPAFEAKGFAPWLPVVHLTAAHGTVSVDLDVDDEALMRLSTYGVTGPEGPRGPLGLSLEDMRAIAAHYRAMGRAPSDIELETIAQSWSEHCKHRIFAAAIDGVPDGIFRTYIAAATHEIMARPDKAGFCLSVFSDNAGAIAFDDDWMVCDKVETHNSPSALDPYGGAMTGIVGVNRDCLGFGLGARPVANRYGFCIAEPDDDSVLYRDAARRNPLMAGQDIFAGVVAGVEAGGNQSGIPTAQGFVHTHPRFRGKPLVFVGTVGLAPRHIDTPDGRSLRGEEKAARPGDRIVVAGGAVGLDGVHGATFSSVALDENSPATAVQIGDPITQKRLSDALIREARDLGLYTGITDNGAGGLSSSIGEMAEGPGGAEVWLDRVPLKYPGLAPWQIWISESQERMSFAVPPENVERFVALMTARGVRAVEIGVFTDDGVLRLMHDGAVCGELALDFLHDGAPRKHLAVAEPAAPDFVEPALPPLPELVAGLGAAPPLTAHEPLAALFDHEVQGASVIKPVQGPGRAPGDATMIAPVPGSPRAVGLSHALFPTLTERAPYAAAVLAVDVAVRRLVAIGADPDRIALQDNFCWCSAEDPDRVWQLREAARGCFEAATWFGAPFISGKDSMFNDFRGFDADGALLSIAALPTVLISSIGIAPRADAAQTMDFKAPGDAILMTGEPGAALGGSIAEQVFAGDALWVPPEAIALTPLADLRALHGALLEGTVASATAIGPGGLAFALSRSARAGRLGYRVDVDLAPAQWASEYGGRFVITCAPGHAQALSARLGARRIGTVTEAQA